MIAARSASEYFAHFAISGRDRKHPRQRLLLGSIAQTLLHGETIGSRAVDLGSVKGLPFGKAETVASW